MEVYLTSHFRKIKRLKCEKIENEYVYFKHCDYYPNSDSDWIIKKPIKGSQNNYHRTYNEAWEFLYNHINKKVEDLKADLIKYQGIQQNIKYSYMIVNSTFFKNYINLIGEFKEIDPVKIEKSRKRVDGIMNGNGKNV
jgi:hypothetical protein